MRYETIKTLKDADFKRLTGVQRETFEKMLEVVEKGVRNFGRPPKCRARRRSSPATPSLR